MEKHIPERMCVVCRTMLNKRDLVRVIKTKEGEIKLDLTGKVSGRGAYICKNCMEKCVKTKALNRAFKESVPQEIYDKLLGEYGEHKN